MSRHVVVVGAGVIGLFGALHARRRGFEVTVVDREGPERTTTSYGNAGLVVPSHLVPLAQPGAVAQGLRWMFDPESPFYVRPTLDPELLAWGWRFWRASTPERARRAGPLLSSTASGPTTAGAFQAPAGEGGSVSIPADEVVLAAGVWTQGLARALGLRLPLRAGKGYSVTLADPPQRPSTPALLSEGRVAITPLARGVRFGGTMEITGAREGVSASRVRGIARSVVRAFPAFTPEAITQAPVWYGFRPCSPDGLPYLGRTRRVGNVIVATGHAMMGVSLAPVTGRLVGELLSGERPSLPLEALSPDRYA